MADALTGADVLQAAPSTCLLRLDARHVQANRLLRGLAETRLHDLGARFVRTEDLVVRGPIDGT